jgi:hypothetical protein
MQRYVLFQPWLHVLHFFICFLRKATRYAHAHNNDLIIHYIVLTKSLTSHCYKQQDNEDMRNISSETSE